MNKYTICSSMEKIKEENPVRFFMPGHKGKALPGCFLNGILPYDVTELPDTDNLSSPSGAIMQSENRIAQIFSAPNAHICAGGCSQALFGALIAATKHTGSKKIVLDRNSHRKVIESCIFLGLEPTYVTSPVLPVFGITSSVRVQDIDKALSDTNAKMVLITSPTYYGVTSDISAISSVCHAHGAILIVDCAHGAHFGFNELTPPCPICEGADLAALSFHKTLPALTGGALLLTSDLFPKEDSKNALSMAGSTSPSYLIMSSVEYGAEYMAENGEIKLSQLISQCDSLKFSLEYTPFIPLTESYALLDPCRITLSAPSDMTGYELYDILYKKGIMAEMADKNNIVFLPSIMNGKEDFKRLQEELSSLSMLHPVKRGMFPAQAPSLPKTALPLREAFFKDNEKIPISESIGRISGEIKCIYPPGVPLLVPGEVIEEWMTVRLTEDGQTKIRVLV
jgi:arginine decarboxylase